MSAWNFPKLIRPFMQELCKRTGESVLLSVLDREARQLTYVEIINSPHPVRYQIPVGTTRPLYFGAAGRLLLAYADKPWRETYLKSVQFTMKTAVPVTRASLARDLEEIRAEGVATSIDMSMGGLAAVAAPILSSEGQCLASLNIAGPSDRFRDELESLKAIVKEVSALASDAARRVESAGITAAAA